MNQAEARKTLEHSQRWHQVLTYGVPDALLRQVNMDVAADLLDEHEECMRRIGHVLVHHGQHDLWRLVYLEYIVGEEYALGDETRFLNREKR